MNIEIMESKSNMAAKGSVILIRNGNTLLPLRSFQHHLPKYRACHTSSLKDSSTEDSRHLTLFELVGDVQYKVEEAEARHCLVDRVVALFPHKTPYLVGASNMAATCQC